MLYDLEVTVEDIAKGKRERSRFHFLDMCHHCNGTGAAFQLRK